MEQEHSHEPELLLPPWPQRRRRFTAVLMIAFILLASSLIGFGAYQLGISMGILTPPLSNQRLTQLLLADGSFVRAMQQAGRQRECENKIAHFTLMFQAPFRPLATSGEDACKSFVAMHPTGADVLVTVTQKNSSRDLLTAELSTSFSTVQADFVSGTNYETTRLSGIRENILTTIYVIGVQPNGSWIITYAPTSPTLDTLVLGIARQFRVYP